MDTLLDRFCRSVKVETTIGAAGAGLTAVASAVEMAQADANLAILVATTAGQDVNMASLITTVGAAGAGLTDIPGASVCKATTVAASPDPTTRSFTLAAGPAYATSYPKGTQVLVTDADDPTNPALGVIETYTAALRVTLIDNLPFTPATGDTVVVLANAQYRPIGGTAP